MNLAPMTHNSTGAQPDSAYLSTSHQESQTAEAAGVANAPRVSVCMPVYNSKRYVAEAIESILGQTFSDFEFLIIDDGSTDGSLEVVEHYAKEDSRIRLTSRPNKGVAGTLIELVNQARGEFIARMDADDIALPERFQKQVDYLREHPECIVVGSRVWEMDAEGDVVREFFSLDNHEAIDARHFQMRGPALVHPSIMMRRDAMLAAGGYRPFYIEDIDLYLRLAERGRLARTPEFLLLYRVHSTNASFTNNDHVRNYRELSQMLSDAYQRRNLPVSLPPPEVLIPEDPWPIVDKYRLTGWTALASGHARTALKYARRALAKKPLSLETWKLVYCAIRGY
jgi:glycosyltransferase involved in cell wall biosynthesis